MRNPNGYGSVVKLSGKRRNPYMVRKTVDYDDNANPKYAILGYFPNRKDAMMALAEYNSKPYDINLSKSTFSELYEAWSALEYPLMGYSLVSAHRAAYKHCTSLYKKPYRDIRKYDMQRCINECGKSYATQTNIRNLFSQLDKYAFDNDIIDKCYSTNLVVSEKEVTRSKKIFTNEEVQTLWAHQGEPCVDEALFMLYTGCRVTEMLTLPCSKIDLSEGIIRHGIKTEAGKGRIIPIHPKILPIIEKNWNDGLLFNKWPSKNEKSRYQMFKRAWEVKLEELGMKHITHECRHTFRSKLDSAEANKVCIDLIMGHKTSDVGERVYTHKSVNELKSAILKLSYDV